MVLYKVNITGNKYVCISKKGTLTSALDDYIKIGSTYLEVDPVEAGIHNILEGVMLITLGTKPEKLAFVEKENFKLVRKYPRELFSIIVSNN